MKTRVLLFVATVAARPPVVGAQHAAPLQSPGGRALTPRDSAFHALNRLAYGPRPGEVERVAQEGVMRWIDRQLAPEQIADGDRAAREREFRVLHYRSEEHTSELQSQSNLVCRLLLEKQ